MEELAQINAETGSLCSSQWRNYVAMKESWDTNLSSFEQPESPSWQLGFIILHVCWKEKGAGLWHVKSATLHTPIHGVKCMHADPLVQCPSIRSLSPCETAAWLSRGEKEKGERLSYILASCLHLVAQGNLIQAFLLCLENIQRECFDVGLAETFESRTPILSGGIE